MRTDTHHADWRFASATRASQLPLRAHEHLVGLAPQSPFCLLCDLKRLVPELERIPCPREQVLMEADSALDHVFFPDSGVVSVLAVYADGKAIEMATIGREGCTGVQATLGAKVSSARFLVQIPGGAAKMSRAAFLRATQSIPAFRNLTNAYVQAFLEQVMVSVACNGAHSLKQRLARWLLLT